MRWLLRLPILAYRYSFSAVLGTQCRYEPTCSAYTDEAIARHGAWPGLWMGAARVCRCHPWGPAGWDPVAEQLPPDARWYKPWRYGRWTGRHMPYRLDRLG
jgi:putative membrane protein insertion efficiency factor